MDMARDMVGKELFTEELLEDFLEKNLRAERILVQIEKQEELLMPLLESACRCGILVVDKGKLWKLLLREGKSVIQKENWAGRIAFALYTLKNYEGKQVLAQVLCERSERIPSEPLYPDRSKTALSKRLGEVQGTGGGSAV